MEPTGTTTASGPALPDYGYSARFRNTSIEEAKRRVTEALKEEGFGVITEIDMRATLKQKIGVDFRPYVILGACNPALAHEALGVDLGVGLLLPCNVCIWEEDGGAVISLIKPAAMFEAVKGPGSTGMNAIAGKVDLRMRGVLARLQK